MPEPLYSSPALAPDSIPVSNMRRHPRPADRDGYAAWGIMPDRRTTRTPALLWHDADGPFDYARAAAMYGLPYTQRDFEDANQSFGVGQP